MLSMQSFDKSATQATTTTTKSSSNLTNTADTDDVSREIQTSLSCFVVDAPATRTSKDKASDIVVDSIVLFPIKSCGVSSNSIEYEI